MDFQGAASAISGIPLDWLIVGIFFVIVAADALRSGPTHAIAFSLALPIASYAYTLVPKTIIIGSLTASFKGELSQLIIFFVITAILVVCIHQMFFAFDQSISLFSAALSGAAATAVLLTIWVETPILTALWHFGPTTEFIFAASYALFWLILSYFALAYAGS